MKKVIAVTAGLMLAGSIAASANAATINFSGDARARFNYNDNYSTGAGGANMLTKNTDTTFWNSRVRLMFKIETKGGAYAVGRFRLTDGMWDGGGSGHTVDQGGTGNGVLNNGYANYNTNYGNKTNLWVDVGYVGLPIGSLPLAFEAGVGYDDFVSDFLRPSTDNYTFARFKYGTDATTLYGFYEKVREYEVTYSTNAAGEKVGGVDNAYMDDNDVDQYGVTLIQKFNPDWSMNATVLYRDDQQTKKDALNHDYDSSGVAASALISGKAGDVGLWAEIAYKQADYQSSNFTSDKPSRTGDDGYGGYVAAKVPLGVAAVSVMVGGTANGYTASHDFGADRQDYAKFVMLSAPSTYVTGFLGTGVLLGSPDGNAWFANVAPSVKVSDQLTLTAEGTYMNAEYGQGKIGGSYKDVTSLDLWEAGFIAQYKVTDGATISFLAGYLDIENADENPVGVGLALDLKF